MNLYEEYESRGLIAQLTHLEPVKDMLDKRKVCIYTGFDPTADSLHVGHLIPVMGLARAQRAGHRVLALVGGATALIGDPTGKSEMRQMLTKDGIATNIQAIKKQLGRFLSFENDQALVVNNADWLSGLGYLDLLREVGGHFSVNRMLSAECFKARLEKGLSFLEFNYMILQAYDFYHLFKTQNCLLQLGGDDQWSNMLAGVDLIRRMSGERQEAYAMTYPLLTTSDGKKMGKTERGAVWLDAEKTTPYEYFQFWRNVTDDKVKDCLCYFTFLSVEEINQLCQGGGETLNQAKEKLAYEATKLAHGEQEADNALQAAHAAFGGGGAKEHMPRTELKEGDYKDQGISIVEMLTLSALASSNGEARRLVKGGGVYVDGQRIENPDERKMISAGSLFELRKGKKSYHLLAFN